MPRAFLLVLDSVGIGGAPDAACYFNGSTPDSGANTVGHIAMACATGKADIGRSGPLKVPTLDAMGLGAAVRLASGLNVPGLTAVPTGAWGAATEVSGGKDSVSGHWEIAGVPVPWNWHYFPDHTPAFPENITQAICQAAGTAGILGNCHAAGKQIMTQFGARHLSTGWPICYTSADSVLQICAHEDTFGLMRLLDVCQTIAPMLHAMKVARVIARPFKGSAQQGFWRTQNRRDFAFAPPAPTLCDWVHAAEQRVYAVGKVGDIFSCRGIDDVRGGNDAQIMAHVRDLTHEAPDRALIFANFIEFDSNYGHTRDIAGYARHLEWFDAALAQLLPYLGPEDLLIVTADHGNDPSWVGTDHTRERVPVLMHGGGQRALGQIGFVDIGACVAAHLGVSPPTNNKGTGQGLCA